MNITKYKHTTYKVEANRNNILIDPGIFVFGQDLLPKDYFSDINILLLSHLHADHFDLEALSIGEKIRTHIGNLERRSAHWLLAGIIKK